MDEWVAKESQIAGLKTPDIANALVRIADRANVEKKKAFLRKQLAIVTLVRLKAQSKIGVDNTEAIDKLTPLTKAPPEDEELVKEWLRSKSDMYEIQLLASAVIDDDMKTWLNDSVVDHPTLGTVIGLMRDVTVDSSDEQIAAVNYDFTRALGDLELDAEIRKKLNQVDKEFHALDKALQKVLNLSFYIHKHAPIIMTGLGNIF